VSYIHFRAGFNPLGVYDKRFEMCDHVESVKKNGHCAICEQDNNCEGCKSGRLRLLSLLANPAI
jgi:hypothetical protein